MLRLVVVATAAAVERVAAALALAAVQRKRVVDKSTFSQPITPFTRESFSRSCKKENLQKLWWSRLLKG
jgi:hypothetical protein